MNDHKIDIIIAVVSYIVGCTVLFYLLFTQSQ